jgi:hypothetical protein
VSRCHMGNALRLRPAPLDIQLTVVCYLARVTNFKVRKESKRKGKVRMYHVSFFFEQ